jgi:hypothetical protein
VEKIFPYDESTMKSFHSDSELAELVTPSVADLGCLSRIPDPDFYPSRIPDLGSRIPDLGSRIQKHQQQRGVKKNVVIPFYVATNFTKLKIILVLKC